MSRRVIKYIQKVTNVTWLFVIPEYNYGNQVKEIEMKMTESQATAMMGMFKKMYLAYKSVGNNLNAKKARKSMLETYLVVRSYR